MIAMMILGLNLSNKSSCALKNLLVVADTNDEQSGSLERENNPMNDPGEEQTVSITNNNKSSKSKKCKGLPPASIAEI